MRYIFLLFLAISLSTLFGATVHEAQSAGGHCTVRDRIQLGQAGYTKGEIEDLCGRNSG
jgi:hypothetical protein